MFLLGKPYETCKSCETLKEQLDIANAEKQQLTATLLNLLKPKVYEQPAQELAPIAPKLAMFSRRKAALEAADREKARTLANSRNIGTPDNNPNQVKDNIEKLEAELGVKEDTAEGES